MKRAVAAMLALGLVVAMAAPAVAKKKKKKKPPPVVEPVQVDQTYFLRRDGEGCTEPAFRFLSLTDAEDFDSGSCGNQTYGLAGGALGTAALEYSSRAGDGIPVTLDATKEITGLIGVKSSSAQGTVRVGTGLTTLEVTLFGQTSEGRVTIATGDFDYTVTPGDINQIYEIEITLSPDAALDKTTFEGLTIALRNKGESVLHGFYTTDNPASFFTMGTWQLPS